MGFPGSVLLNQGDIYKQTSDKRYPLGTRGYTRDGRVFRYAECSSTAISAAGSLLQSSLRPDSANWADDLAVGTAPTSNSTSIYITATTACATANYFADGYLYVNDACGQGQLVQIKSHAAMTSGATAQEIKLYESDKIIHAMTTASKVGLVANLWKDVIIKPATLITAPIVGVNPIPITASYFFWCQTWGPAPVITTAALDINYPVVLDSAGAGSVQKMGEAATGGEFSRPFVVGQALTIGSGAGDNAVILLTIAP